MQLTDDTRRALSELARRDDAALAEKLGVSRVTLSRALAGLRVQRGTIALLERGYETMKGGSK